MMVRLCCCRSSCTASLSSAQGCAMCVAMTQRNAAEQWSENLHARIGQAIRSARSGRRMSAQQVADETEHLRYPITRSQIANYESGRKQSLDIAELMTIAAALEVPPLSLILGGHPDQEIEFLPGQMATTAAALAWLLVTKRTIRIPFRHSQIRHHRWRYYLI